MRAASLDELLEEEDCYRRHRTCQGCGLELEPEEDECCYLCASGFPLSDSAELKGGESEMADTEPKGDKPDFKGSLEVVAWTNTDRYGKKFLTIQLGNRANLFKNEPKQDAE